MYERVGYFYIKAGRTLIGMSCFFCYNKATGILDPLIILGADDSLEVVLNNRLSP